MSDKIQALNMFTQPKNDYGGGYNIENNNNKKFPPIHDLIKQGVQYVNNDSVSIFNQSQSLGASAHCG